MRDTCRGNLHKTRDTWDGESTQNERHMHGESTQMRETHAGGIYKEVYCSLTFYTFRVCYRKDMIKSIQESKTGKFSLRNRKQVRGIETMLPSWLGWRKVFRKAKSHDQERILCSILKFCMYDV